MTLHVWVLFSFAVAQPVYDILSRNAEFLVARQSEPIDLFFLILVLSLVQPAALMLIQAVAWLCGRKVHITVHAFFLMGLSSLLALQALKKLLPLPGIYIVVLAGITGLLATAAYFRWHPVRYFLNVVSPAILIFPALLLFNSPVYDVAFPEPAGEESGEVKNEVAQSSETVDHPPVVIIVFDEMPITSLMNEHQQIDAELYPNFAALARQAYWFRNASTVSTTTADAVPAILSGQFPDEYRLPNVGDYPNNLFTLLGGTYDMEVYEPVTQLCPDDLCTREETPLRHRMASLISDITFVYLHIVLPEDLTSNLPVVTQTWKDFAADADSQYETAASQKSAPEKAAGLLGTILSELRRDRKELFRQFIQRIRNTGRPTLYFCHIYLPHAPWIYLPSGKNHNLGLLKRGLINNWWGDNKLYAIEAYRGHLFQVGFVDTLLGELMDRLKAEDLYDRALMVVTADHGISFKAGDARRNVTPTNYMDILPIPLFIKLPQQIAGEVNDRNVETIDILPTVAALTKVPLPWPVDGQSVFDATAPERKKKVIYDIFRLGPERMKIYGSSIDAKAETLKRKICLFGNWDNMTDSDTSDCVSFLVGKPVDDFKRGDPSALEFELDSPMMYENFSLEADLIPIGITGLIFDELGNAADYPLAVAVNGIVRAMAALDPAPAGGPRFSAIVPASSFRQGYNDISLYRINGMDVASELIPLRRKRVYSSYILTDGKALATQDGKPLTVTEGALKGYLDHMDIIGKTVVFQGWAADVKNKENPKEIIIFVDGKFIYTGRCNETRTDLGDYFGDKTFEHSGFHYRLPLDWIDGLDRSKVRVFAATGEGVASELKYPGK